MSRLFYHTMQDNLGNLLFDVTGTMRLTQTATLATIYGDEALSVILPNPMTNHPSFGSFKCYLGPGHYDFYMAKGGYTFETMTGVQGAGTMAQQNAGAVTITGGSALGLSQLQAVNAGLGRAPDALYNLATQGDTLVGGHLGISTVPIANIRLSIGFAKADRFGIRLAHTGGDTGTGEPVAFVNAAGTPIGSITSTGSGVAYNTTSDGRLKEAVTALTGALGVVLALNPVSFLWKADGSQGHGLVAQDVAQVVPGVVSGTETLGIDYGKLVPYLIGAVKELTQQVEMLQAQLAAADV